MAKIDEDNMKSWEIAVNEEEEKKCQLMISKLVDKKSGKPSLKPGHHGSFHSGSKPLCGKAELLKSKKSSQFNVFKKQESKKSSK